MSTKFVYTVPATALDESYPLNLKKITDIIRGTVSTKCVYTVSETALDESYTLQWKINC